MADKTYNGIQFPNKTSGQGRDADPGFVRLYFKNGNIFVVDENSVDTKLTGVAETDPVFMASAASNVTNTNISNWNTAYGWGNHASAGYLTSVALNNISDVTITSPSNGQVLKYNGTIWVNATDEGGSGGASISISDTAPSSPSAGALWWDSELGKLFIYYTDADSSQWVEAVPSGFNIGSGTSGIELTDISVGADAAASGSGGIAYNNTTGVFTYTPPDLSSYLTSETNDLTSAVTWANVPDANITQSSVTQHQGALSITESQISDFGTYATTASLATVATTGAYSDLSGAPTTVSSFTNDAGYLTSETTTSLSLSLNILTYTDETGTDTDIDLSLYLDDTNLARLTSGSLNASTGIATFTRDDATTFDVDFSALLNVTLADLSVGADAAASGSGGISYNNTTGVFTYTPPDLSSYLTSIPAEYLTQTEGDARYLQLTGGSLTGNLSLGDAIEARFGLGSGNGYDLRIYHNGTSYIENTTTHSLIFKNPIQNYIVCQPSNAVTLYHNGSSKVSTASDGISVSGNITVSGTVDGRDLSVDGIKLDGIESGAQANVGTDLGNTATGTSFTITSSTGNNTNLPAATTSAWGMMTDNDKTKLDGIETGADVTDADNVNPLVDAHLNTSTATTNQVLSWTGSDYDWVAQSGGGASTLNDLTDVTIASVADGDILRYNGTAGEWQNTNLGLSLTPTLSAASTQYLAALVTITNWGSYQDPAVFAQLKNSGGTVVVTNDNITVNDSGVISFSLPSTAATYTLEVQVQDFGDLASDVATINITKANANFRYYRVADFSNGTASVFINNIRYYSGAGQTGTAYPSDMTASNAPSPYVASASWTYTPSSPTYDPWKPYDNSTFTGWWTLASTNGGIGNEWNQIDLGSSPPTILSFYLRHNSASYVCHFKVYGSNTGAFSGEESLIIDSTSLEQDVYIG